MQFIRGTAGCLILVLFGLIGPSFQVITNSGTLSAQEVDRFVQGMDHVFTNKEGDVVADGRFVKVAGSRIVVEEDGEEIKVLIADLCEEDQEWVKKTAKAQKTRESARKRFQKLMEDNLTSRSEAKVASGLTGVRKLGKAASFATSTIERFMGPEHPEKVRYQAFLAYAAIKNQSAQGVESVLQQLINDRADAMGRIEKAPRDFMAAMATFEDLSMPYLTFAAYTGEIIPDDTRPEPPAEAANNLSRDQIKVRDAAVAAIASLPSDEAADVILNVLEAAETPKSGEPDSSTIKACIVAFGRMGMSTPTIEDKLEDFETEFAAQVKAAREKIERANNSDD